MNPPAGHRSGRGATVSIRPGPLRGHLRAPSSKSVTNRLLVMAALAEGRSELVDPLLSDDTHAMAGGLRALGVPVELSADLAVVEGRGGSLHPVAPVDAGLSGTTLRFLAAVSLLTREPVVLTGEPALRRRPLGALLQALQATGARVESDNGHAPVRIEPARLSGGRMVVDAAESSQFATALLLVAPYAAADVELVVENLGASGYVELTVGLMGELGAEVSVKGQGELLVRAGRHYRPGRYEVEYDASAAAHLFAAGVASGGAVTVSNAKKTLQPDSAVPGLLVDMGARLSEQPAGGLTLQAPDGPLRAIEADLTAIPDQLPTLATLAALAEGESRFSGIAVSRGHETDRPAAVAAELGRLGAEVALEEDLLVVRGGRPLGGATVDSYGDHRMAMAFGALATAVPGLRIAGAECVKKTYPAWWEDLRSLGADIEIS